jgi:hypothetical protein
VNFYSHVAIASLYTEEVGIALGAMLPDLARLVGAKLPRTTNPSIQRGYALHQATDRVFHESELFRSACAAESATLRSQGVERGTAMAAAHVGLELLLDEALSDDERSQALFRTTLEMSTPTVLCQSLEWSSAEQAIRFESLRQRLEQIPHPRPEYPPTVFAERVCRTLSNRPRLAVRAGDRAALQAWTAELPPRRDATWPGLVKAVILGLERASWRVRPALARELRFRRARRDEV